MSRLSTRRLTRFLPAVFQLEDRCTPATINVTSLADTVAVDGAVTLREAIQSVNAGANVNADVAVTGYGTSDTITFTGLSGTITLTSELDPLRKPVAILGTTTGSFNQPLVTVEGKAGALWAFAINAANVTLRGLSIVGADYGVLLEAKNAVIAGNYIGIRSDGTTVEANSGIYLRGGSSNNIIGGLTSADRNVISGHGTGGASTGVIFQGTGVTGNVMVGNYIGTNAAGTAALPNERGVLVSGGASNNTIGGTTAGTGNVISGNNIGVLIFGAGTTGNMVAGNFIGTNATGTVAVPNGVGVFVSGGASGATISGNVISGNTQSGVWINGTGTSGNVVTSNYIGTNGVGTSALPNNIGVEVSAGATNTLIGGTTTGAGNVIAFNSQAGVFVDGSTSGVQILGNSIYSNTGPGINLSAGTTPDGETANDPQDIDTGGNDLQNYPVFTSVVGASVAGVLNSTPNRTFRVELFASDAQPPSRFGQGQRFLGAVTVTTDGSGVGSFTFTAPSDLTGQVVSATATDLTTNSTSEFGLTRADALLPRGPKSVLVVGAGPGGPAVVVVYNPDGSERGRIDAFPGFSGGVRVATADVNGDGNLDIIAAAGPGGGPHVKVFDGVTGAEIRSFYAYDSSFTGGVWVAGGDVNGVGFAEIITGAGAGGAPHVRVFDGKTGAERVGFYAYAPSFTGGVTVAVGDFNNDGFTNEIVTGAGAGGAPHVKVIGFPVWSQVNADGTIKDSALLASFYAYSPTFTGGVFVSSGADFDNDGKIDIVTGAGSGGGPHVKIVNTAQMNIVNVDGTIADASLLASFYAFEEQFAGGVRVGEADALQDGVNEIIVGAGPTGGPRVRVLRANGLAAAEAFYAFVPEYTGGVFVD